MDTMTPEVEAHRKLALLQAETRIRAAQPQVDRRLAALLSERYPHAWGRLMVLGYPVTVDGVSTATDGIDRAIERAAGAGSDLADLWEALDQAIYDATGSGLIVRGG
jgi:hypothetical protein